MQNILHPELQAKLIKALYHARFLIVYAIIGVLSLALEIGIRALLIDLGLAIALATIIAVVIAILFAFWANVTFNFAVPKKRRNRALLYFALISCISVLIQTLIAEVSGAAEGSYAETRYMIAGVVAWFAYVAHRYFSFRHYRKVGVAVYAKPSEDIRTIHARIGQLPDFIHVDIVDETFNEAADIPTGYRLEVVRSLWPNKHIHCHIMSRHPTRWLEHVLPFCDLIFVHYEIDDPLDDVFAAIRAGGRKVGLAFSTRTTAEEIAPICPSVDAVLCLSIPKPGFSGQKFDTVAYDSLRVLNELADRNSFELCVDGGITVEIARTISAEYIVSGSAILNHERPQTQLLRFQNSLPAL